MKKTFLNITILLSIATLFSACEEKQNKINRYIQNWTGVNGVIEVYAGEKLVKRFMKIDKLSTAVATEGSQSRAYRYGYGYLDTNLNYEIDENEKKKVYFEVSDYSTYVFFEKK